MENPIKSGGTMERRRPKDGRRQESPSAKWSPSGKPVSRTVLVSLILMLAIAGPAAAAPQLPCAFYGQATINGRPAPSGSVITAQIDEISRGSAVVSPDGKYGGPTITEGKLSVYEGSNGDEVTFYLQTPSMSNRLEAGQKGTWQSGEVFQLDLIFTGEEIPRVEQPPAAGGGSGSSGTGSENTGSPSAPVIDEQQFQNQGKVYDITGNITSGNASLKLGKGDEVKFSYNGKDVSVKVKSMSDFAVLFSTPGGDIVIAEKGSGSADIDGDGFAELLISVGKVNGEKAEAVFSLLQKPAVTSGPGATGLFLTNESGLWISLSAIVAIAVIGGGIYLWRKRGVKNEGYQGFK
jgi:hypothetical protein